MILTIKTKDNLTVTIDTDKCEYPRHFEKAYRLALEIEGHDKETIDEIFGKMPAMGCVPVDFTE